MRSINWDAVFGNTLLVYFHWLVVAGAYFVAQFLFTYSRRKSDDPASLKHLILPFVYCVLTALIIGWFFADMLGTHQEGDDPSYTVRDYYPSSKQYWTYWAKVSFTILPAGIIGVINGYIGDRKLTPEKRRDRNLELNKPEGSNY